MLGKEAEPETPKGDLEQGVAVAKEQMNEFVNDNCPSLTYKQATPIVPTAEVSISIATPAPPRGQYLFHCLAVVWWYCCRPAHVAPPLITAYSHQHQPTTHLLKLMPRGSLYHTLCSAQPNP